MRTIRNCISQLRKHQRLRAHQTISTPPRDFDAERQSCRTEGAVDPAHGRRAALARHRAPAAGRRIASDAAGDHAAGLGADPAAATGRQSVGPGTDRLIVLAHIGVSPDELEQLRAGKIGKHGHTIDTKPGDSSQ